MGPSVSVFNVLTIPRTDFIAWLAIPVLNPLEVISTITTPLVSEPVPAVVGTIRGVRSGLKANGEGCLACIQWPELFSDWQALA